MPWLRGAALKAQAPVAVKLPLAFVTGNEGARGLLEQAGVAVSLCRLDIRDEVVGGNPAGEAAIEICRRWQLDEPRTRASCEIIGFPPAVLAADAREVPYRRRLVSCQCER